MKVKCVNCGTIYSINLTPMDFTTELERIQEGQCPCCSSNVKDRIDKTT